MKSSSDEIKQIRTSFERILKGFMSKLEDGDEQFVTEELKWIDNKLNDLFKLRIIDFDKFKSLIDSNNQCDFDEPIDFSDINWDEVKIVRGPSSQELSEQKQRDVRKYNLSFFDSYSYDLIDTFISFLIKSWTTSIKVGSFEAARTSLFILGNLYSNISLLEDERLDFSKLYGLFVTKLTFQTEQLVSKKHYTDDNITLIQFLAYRFHLAHFLDVNFEKRNFENLRSGILLSLKSSLENRRLDIVKSFIRTLTEGAIVPPSSSGYSDLYSFISKKYHDLKIDDNETLKKIPDYGLWKPYYCFTSEDFEIVNNGLNELRTTLFEQISSDDDRAFIQNNIEELEIYVLKMYKYRLMQRTLISILVYSLFKMDYELIDYAFDFNQPSDASATWANRDIVPNNLSEILSIIKIKFSIEQELVFQMPDHHGATEYINIFLLKALKHWNNRRRDQPEEIKNVIESFSSRDEMMRNPGILEGIRQSIKDLGQVGEFSIQRKNYPFQDSSSDELDSFMTLINELETGFEQNLNRIERKQEIKNERIQTFSDNILSHFNKTTFYRSLIRKGNNISSQNDDAQIKHEFTYTIGFNELLNRSAFLENWHIPTYGLVESIGNQLAEQEDFTIERQLNDMFGKGDEVEVSKLLDYYKKVRDSEIIIFKNYYPDEFFNEDFVPKWKLDSLKDENFVLGQFRNSLVYRYQTFGLSKLIITNTNLGEIHTAESDKYPDFENKNSFFIKVIDFGTEEAEISKFLEKPPKWLEDKYSDIKSKEDFLSNKLWLRIYGTFKWSIPNNLDYKAFIIPES
ncbi:MAG: hypothetical protein RLQ12_03090 [Cyclobacteriaceae bacterium]